MYILQQINMTIAFVSILNSNLIEKLIYSDNEDIKKKISTALIRKDKVSYTDQELFLREDPNSCHYFPYKMDLTSDHLICRQEFDELCLQVQEFQNFKSHTEFLLCLKDNLHDHIITILHQLFSSYYSVITHEVDYDEKNALNEILATHDYLNSLMEKIDVMLGEQNQSTYKFYTLQAENHYNTMICFHIKTSINFPDKMFVGKDNKYLVFKELTLPTSTYKTRSSLLIKCPKCGEQYHQNKNNNSNAGRILIQRV